MTVDEYWEMWNLQAGRCAICREHLILVDRQVHVDHDHQSGRVRGLLCADCNVGLGRFVDNPDTLDRAAAYLRAAAADDHDPDGMPRFGGDRGAAPRRVLPGVTD